MRVPAAVKSYRRPDEDDSTDWSAATWDAGFDPFLPVSGLPFGATMQPGVETLAVTAVEGYDAAANKQWSLKAIFGADPNAVLKQFNGQGVSIGVFDDGIDKKHAALMSSYDAKSELTLYGRKLDPTAGSSTTIGKHGTAVAGIIVADASTNGGADTGLAYGATITAVNIFNGYFYNEIGQMYKFDVTNNSYGWTTKWCDALSGYVGSTEWNAYKTAVTYGRDGLGTVIVAAAGNSWSTKTQTAHTEMGSTRWVIDVGATQSNGDIAAYSTRGSNVLVSAPTGVYTTDRVGSAGYSTTDYVSSFGGTSAAAPAVTAVVADMLSADSDLGWRDIQKILAITANNTHSAGAKTFTTAATGNMAYGWTVNGAVYDQVNGGGLHFSNDYGFGQIDGHAAIREAEVWHYFSAYSTSANEVAIRATSAQASTITAGKVATFTLNITKAEEVENAALTLNLTSSNLNGLKIELISPSGTDSILLSPSSGTQSASGLTWSLASHAFLGENSVGTWTVKVTDMNAKDTARIAGVTLDLYGSATPTNQVYHYTDDVFATLAYDPSLLKLDDTSSLAKWIDTAPMSAGNLVLDLVSGHTSTMNGKAFVTIANNVTVNNATVADGTAIVYGNDNANTIVAGQGTATVQLGAGNDTLYAGYGVLTAAGGAGRDTFAYDHAGFGVSTILDFQLGLDRIDLRGIATSFAALKVVDLGASIKIVVDGVGDASTLANMDQMRLTANDFLFA